MSFLEYRITTVPTGFRKILHLNWALVLLICAVATAGFLMLYSVAGGSMEPWAGPQLSKFILGLAVMFVIGFVPIWFWQSLSGLAYAVAFLLLLGVEFFGHIGMGAQRWIELGPIRLQPSEMMKFTLVMALAAYYDALDSNKVSKPLWVLIPVLIIVAPTVLVLMQPNLGTSLMLILGGSAVMFCAGVSIWYFGAVIAVGVWGGGGSVCWARNSMAITA